MEDKITLKRIIKLFGIYAKLDLVLLLRDTKSALALIVADVISNISTLSGMFLIAVRFGGIGGMSPDEVLFMLAYSTLTTGIFILFGANNNIHISRIIGRGQMEHMFVQPLPFAAQLLTSGFCPFTSSSNFIVGVVLLVVAIQRLALQISALWVLALLGYILATMVIIVARSYLVSSITFYAPVAAEEISTTAIDGTWTLSTFPLSGMPRGMQLALMTVLPEGLMAWFPSLCLLGKSPLIMPAYYPMLFALMISLTAAYFFRKGFNYYVKTGSNRYVPYGFRR